MTKKRIEITCQIHEDGSGNKSPRIFQKILERNYLDLRRNLNFSPMKRSSWEEVRKKAGKAEEKLKAALKDPKMGSLG